jgi:hypothetical protein
MPITNNNNLFQDYGKRFGRGDRRLNNQDGAMQRMNNLVKNQNDARIGHHTDRFDQTQQTNFHSYGRRDRTGDDLSMEISRRSGETDTRLTKEENDYLDKLKEKYSNVDFVIADFEDGEDTSRFATGDKEYTCVITPALLKKMAADEATAAKYEKVIEGAGADLDSMKEQISALDTDESEADPVNLKEQVQNYGFNMDDSGKVSYFALLRDSLPDQNGENKYQYFEADSVESLIEKLKNAVDEMRKAKEEMSVTDSEKAEESEQTEETEQAEKPAETTEPAAETTTETAAETVLDVTV